MRRPSAGGKAARAVTRSGTSSITGLNGSFFCFARRGGTVLMVLVPFLFYPLSLCVWLASDEASFVTGQVVYVAGGPTA